MKRSIKILALALVAVMLCVSFAACGKKLSGTYSAEIAGTGAEYKFSGSKVTITPKLLGASGDSIEGKYSIKDGKITFEFDSDDDDAKEYSGTFDFEETDDGIKIGIVEYKKK